MLVILLGVKAAGSAANLRKRSDSSQLGTRVDLNSPALIVGQMKVKHIELVERHQIDVLLDFLDREKVARRIDHRAAPSEARAVNDGNCRHGPASVHTDV